MKPIILSSAQELSKSVDFYSKLKFEILPTNGPAFVSDGQTIIEINSSPYYRSGIKLFKKDWSSNLSALEKITKVIQMDDYYILGDGSGIWIYLMPEIKTSPDDLSQISPSVLGNFAGLSLEVLSIELSMRVWRALGFSTSMGSVEQGWISLVNEEEFAVSLMKAFSCPHQFFNPSLTYFNGEKNLEVIKNIRNLQIPITEEITAFNDKGIVDNIIIRDPGGLGFFLFSD